MKLEIIGAYSAFVKTGTTTSMVVWTDDGKGILLDCGYSVFQRLCDLGYTQKIGTILLSHMHQDHCGSAVTLLEYNYFMNNHPMAIGGVSWDRLLQLCEGEGYESKITELPDTIKVETFEVPHAKNMECKAIMVNDSVLYSGDTAISILDTSQAKKAKIIIHDAGLQPNHLHASISMLSDAPAEIKAKTYFIHYLPQNYEGIAAKAKELGFGGVVKSGDVFEI